MKVQKVWMSQDTARKSHMAWRTLGGIMGIALLMLTLILGGVLLSFRMDWPKEVSSMILCIGVTVLGITLGLRLGHRSAQDGTVFFLTDNGRLFGMQVDTMPGYRWGAIRCTEDLAKTQKFLRRLAEKPFLPSLAEEILRVKYLRETRSGYTVRCLVRCSKDRQALRTWFFARDCQDADLLVQQLERRQNWESSLEPPPPTALYGMIFSILAVAALAALCVMSHPFLGRLPQVIYYPCLAASVVAFGVAAYFGVRWRRGE